jgi:hypothetical protein
MWALLLVAIYTSPAFGPDPVTNIETYIFGTRNACMVVRQINMKLRSSKSIVRTISECVPMDVMPALKDSQGPRSKWTPDTERR